MSNDPTKPLRRIVAPNSTRANTDEQMLESWLASLGSPHSRLNFAATARRFLVELPAGGIRAAKVDSN